jgi:ATP/maltotriose-dependent transcriptional regulator MalT
MELLERDRYIEDLEAHYLQMENGNGHAVFLMGEAGIGKTSLLNSFVKRAEHSAIVYSGACDSLFTPRPLSPLFDISVQIGQNFTDLLNDEKDRSLIFTTFIQKLSSSTKPVVLIFEDIHWADEATIDLIKFLARRIDRYRCLFLLTYRDGEIHSRHPLASLFGELPSGNFSKIVIHPFSKDVVNTLAAKKGYTSGEKLYTLTGGNPFYVMEILSNYDHHIPERVKDSILTVFNSKRDGTRALWEFLSILPSSRIELSIVKRIENEFADCIDDCMKAGVIVSRPGYLSFKHELFRLAIEESLPLYKRQHLHKKMLQIIHETLSNSSNLSQLVHHARYADERELVAKTAPQAAQRAALVGAHIEASKLYLTAIEYTDKEDPSLAELYERHAYECYLTNQIATAITSQQNALDLWRKRKVSLKIGDTLRFLSRLWWFEGDQQKAITLALQAIEVLENGFPTRERAQAYSNYSQLYMLSDDLKNALLWGNKAIELATRMEDYEILSHALNNVGNSLLKQPSSEREGEEKLNQSLLIALENGFQEHVARAYTNLLSSFVLIKQYKKAMDAFDAGLKYCEEHDLDLWTYYMLNCKVQLLLETGKWNEAETLARSLQSNPYHPIIVKVGVTVALARLEMRRGRIAEARPLLQEARTMAMPMNEAQRIVPVLAAELELYLITGEGLPLNEIRKAESTLFYEKNNSRHYSELAYWMRKCDIPLVDEKPVEFVKPFRLDIEGDWKAAAKAWKELGCSFEQALSLFYGDEESQKQALQILDELGAPAICERLKSKLRLMGVKNIPRGPRESTRSNPAQLTNRQIDVLVLLDEGLQNTEIANKLFISVKTVDHHISAILSKLGTNTRAKAVSEAKRLGILS